jgi:predicted deacylase
MEPFKIQIISKETAGDLRKNQVFMKNLHEGSLASKLLDAAHEGTPMIRIGKGSPKIMLTAGIHGNELSPQVAALVVAQRLIEEEVNGTVYLVPFAIPFATMRSSRRFKGFDMNRAAFKEGSLSNEIIQDAKDLKLDSLADFHATKPYSNPGVESIFCSKKPCPESFRIAEHINKTTNSKIICHKNAGTLYKGALEDECNELNIPAVTCEVVSHNGKVDPGSHERSYLQMVTYMSYFGIEIG